MDEDVLTPALADHAPVGVMRRTRSTSVATVVYTPPPQNADTSAGGGQRSRLLSPSSVDDMRNAWFLLLLYFVQGIPMGLAFGSVPFLLKGSNKLSYAQLGLFSLAGYPYGLKLLWSPIVDSVYSRTLGRRKSWIIPVQALSGLLMFYLGSKMDAWLRDDTIDIYWLTLVFTVLIFLTATQDIAVDGWALSLLSHANRGYAATCQTIGLNTGYFMAFTIFLALNSPDLANSYVRPLLGLPARSLGFLQLGVFIKLAAILYLGVTLLILLFKREAPTTVSSSVGAVYKEIVDVVRMPNMRRLIVVLLVCKLGFAANDNVSALKLIDLGFKREHLALTVLLDFPFQLLIGYAAARYARHARPLSPWLWAYVARMLLTLVSMLVIAAYPTASAGGVPLWYYVAVMVSILATSCASTVMFVCASAYFSVISDPAIGGTYMTLLNTFANLGGMWPQYFVMKAVDFATVAVCHNTDSTAPPFSCVDLAGKDACTRHHGTCLTEADGFYPVSIACAVIGFGVFVYLRHAVKQLEELPESAWRVNPKRGHQ